MGAEWVQHIAARSRGTREWREGRRWVERHAAAMETGKAQEQNKGCPADIRLWCAYDGVAHLKAGLWVLASFAARAPTA